MACPECESEDYELKERHYQNTPDGVECSGWFACDNCNYVWYELLPCPEELIDGD